MVQVFDPTPVESTASLLGKSIGMGLGKLSEKQKQQQQQTELAKLLFPNQSDKISNLTPEETLKAAQIQAQKENVEQKIATQRERSNLMQNLFGVRPEEDITDPGLQSQHPSIPRQDKNENIKNLSDQDIAMVGMYDPQLARVLQSQKKERQRFAQEERSYHTQFTKDLTKKAEDMRESLPRKEMALHFARDAVQSGDVGAFSKNALADAVGGKIGDALRSAKGAQLVTASKENLLSNMSRVSARAQNKWFEQRLNSMFPKIGQSDEANFTVSEMLEGELAMDQAYLNLFDQLSKQDEENFGYVRKDISRRIDEKIKPLRKKIFSRTNYRMKELAEREKGLKNMKKEVGKTVLKGTPLTLGMLKLYYDKFGDQAIIKAKENGYKVPSVEDFQEYKMDNSEFMEFIGS